MSLYVPKKYKRGKLNYYTEQLFTEVKDNDIFFHRSFSLHDLFFFLVYLLVLIPLLSSLMLFRIS